MIWSKLSEPSPGFLLLGALWLVLVFPVSAQRWKLVLAAMGRGVGFFPALAIVTVGQFFNLVLPSTIGGDVVRVLLARRRGISAPGAIASVVIDRLWHCRTAIQPAVAPRLQPAICPENIVEWWARQGLNL